MQRKRFGIVGGLGPLASADIFYKLIRHTPAGTDQEHFDIVFEQRRFDERPASGDNERFEPTARKLYVFNLIKRFEEQKLDAVILPCFISHTFLDELKAEIKLPVVNMMTALKEYLQQHHPEVVKLGILTSNFVRTQRLFEAYFDATHYRLIYPSADLQTLLSNAIYGRDGIKAGKLAGRAVADIGKVCEALVDQGVQLLLPGFTEIPTVLDTLDATHLPIVDSNRIYAEYAIRSSNEVVDTPHRVGVVGGIGPAATVDFMQKIVRHTEARHDQEHIKLVVHHNPQIPDRTEYLINEGVDPTIPLFATCRRLEADEVDFIAMPCNTAHAFVDRLQRYLSIPIINMLTETVTYIDQHYPHIRHIGLLATNGTIASRIYHHTFAETDYKLIEPGEAPQQAVMNAIYGDQGVKAGHTQGRCQDDLQTAIEDVTARGAQAVLLGCTELPLLVDEEFSRRFPSQNPIFLDPTDILAKRCVGLVRMLSDNG